MSTMDVTGWQLPLFPAPLPLMQGPGNICCKHPFPLSLLPSQLSYSSQVGRWRALVALLMVAFFFISRATFFITQGDGVSCSFYLNLVTLKLLSHCRLLCSYILEIVQPQYYNILAVHIVAIFVFKGDIKFEFKLHRCLETPSIFLY